MVTLLNRHPTQNSWETASQQVVRPIQLSLFPPKIVQLPLFSQGEQDVPVYYCTQPHLNVKGVGTDLRREHTTPLAVQVPLFPPGARQLTLFS